MGEVVFNEELHKYTCDGKELISVTTLLKKHGLSPSYGDVPPDILKKAAEKGTLVHKEIETYIKTGEVGFSAELNGFMRELKKRDLKVLKSEFIVNNDLVAGTVDCLVEDRAGRIGLIDFKTTSKVYKESVMWQLNLYADLCKDSVDWLECWHFDVDGNVNVIAFPFLDYKEIDRLYSCERNGEFYKYKLQGLEDDLKLLANYEEALAEFEAHKKDVEDKAKKIRAKILDAMVTNNIKNYESDRLKFTVREGGERRTIDTTKLFEENPNLNKENYEKVSITKPTLLITIKPKANEIENKED